jgi:predicted signal transduction protein with EAL and GGDEF domain
MLVGVADRLRSCLRDDMQALAGSHSGELHGMAARLGGDEFAVVLDGLADEAPAVRVAERILESLRAPFLIDGKEAFVEASVGIALDTIERCGQTQLRNADLAMYQAKRNGEGRYEVFEPALRMAFLRRLDLEADLRHAVTRAEFLLHFQPIFALESDRLVGVEALLRWQHPQRGLIAPREFIPLAEETGLILPIDIWALTHACAQASHWNRQRGKRPPLTLSVNLSVRQLQRADLPDIVARTLLNTGLAPEQLVLEITESVLLHRTEVILDRLRELKKLRVRLALDDFGTGYSSLAYLRHLPVDILKIDKSFVDEITSRPEASGLARAIVQLGRTLGLVTVAEGIEALDQRNELREAGCDLGQGFYFAKPLTAAEIEPLLLENDRSYPTEWPTR